MGYNDRNPTFFAMKLSRLVLSALMMLAPAYAAQVWAPGVSASGGWVDYDKGPVNDGVMADTGMCWAASASNVIRWWMNQNNGLTSSAALPQDPWTVFRQVYQNIGSTPGYALGWYIDGVRNQWGDLTLPGGYDATGFPTVENKENAKWPYGGFLSSMYSTSLHKVYVGSNPDDTDGRTLSLNILDAMESGYALTLSAYSEAGNFQVAHAITLWGVEYSGEGNDRTITRMWITDSDDGKQQLVEYGIASKEAGIAFSSGTMSGALIRYADGMWTDPAAVPEPASATLSLLALAALAARRRRK